MAIAFRYVVRARGRAKPKETFISFGTKAGELLRWCDGDEFIPHPDMVPTQVEELLTQGAIEEYPR